MTTLENAVTPLVERLLQIFRAGSRTTCAWLNHHTALEVMEASVEAGFADLVLVDGQLLSRIAGKSSALRTSADSVLPPLLDALPPARVAILGGRPEALNFFLQAFSMRWPRHEVVVALDGYAACPSAEEFYLKTRTAVANLVIIGLGAPLQEKYLAVITRTAPRDERLLAFTCGGWMDQFVNPGYYPRWAYPLGLTWLVRLIREPGRLWRRYSVEGVRAVVARTRIRRAFARWEEQ